MLEKASCSMKLDACIFRVHACSRARLTRGRGRAQVSTGARRQLGGAASPSPPPEPLAARTCASIRHTYYCPLLPQYPCTVARVCNQVAT